ncbi:MAG: hypothetical protein ABSG48_10770, partial [Geobacteraceae bacterium]
SGISIARSDSRAFSSEGEQNAEFKFSTDIFSACGSYTSIDTPDLIPIKLSAYSPDPLMI